MNVGTISVTLKLKTVGFEAKMRKADRALERHTRNLIKLRKAQRQIGASMTRYVTVPIVAGAALAARAFTKFDSAMRNVNTIAKESEEQFRKTTESVKQLSMQLGTDPTELAHALYNINSAGFRAKQAMDVLEISAKAGRAGLADTAIAAKAITGAMNAYADSGLTAAEAGDIFFKTVDIGVINFQELSRFMGTTMASASAMKIPLKHVGAAVSVLTKGGIEAAESFTALNRMILRIAESSPKMEKALRAAGFTEGGEKALREHGLLKVMAGLTKQSKGYVSELMKMGFRVRGVKSALGLGREAGKMFDEAAVAMEKSAGALNAALAEQDQALAVMGKKILSTLKVIGIDLVKEFSPMLSVMLTHLQKFVKTARAAPKPVKMLAVALAGLAALAGPLLFLGSSLGLMSMGLGALATSGFLTTLAGIGTALTPIGIGLGVAAVAVGVLSESFADGETALERYVNMLKLIPSALDDISRRRQQDFMFLLTGDPDAETVGADKLFKGMFSQLRAVAEWADPRRTYKAVEAGVKSIREHGIFDDDAVLGAISDISFEPFRRHEERMARWFDTTGNLGEGLDKPHESFRGSKLPIKVPWAPKTPAAAPAPREPTKLASAVYKGSALEQSMRLGLQDLSVDSDKEIAKNTKDTVVGLAELANVFKDVLAPGKEAFTAGEREAWIGGLGL